MVDIICELEVMEQLLRKYNDPLRADIVVRLRDVFRQDESAFWPAINNLGWWGGSGSMADLYLFRSDLPSQEVDEDNRRYRRALIAIGEAMLEAGYENNRARWWVGIFRIWEREGGLTS